MNKVNKEKTKELSAGLLYNGSSFYINGYWNTCNHSCPKNSRRQHNVSGNWVNHMCVNAP